MLELLILYSLNKTELTLYGLRKHIIQNFGEISKPSHGALHPALKRLKDKNVISERKKLSDGGKLYSFYSVNNGFKEYFNDKYAEINKIKNSSLEIFLTELKTRIFVADIVDSSILDRFKEISILKIEQYKDVIEQKINNSYLELNSVQKNLLNLYLTQLDDYKKIVLSI